MKITRTELLERYFTDDGRCHGKLRLHGDGGESIELACNVPGHLLGGSAALNKALAQDALRQLARMPEFRRAPCPTAADFALPKGRKQRRLRLSF
ncbi:hypothetical protein N6L24_07080 [Cognatishimia sp. SS12]|uniref:hypothetical protein n=1 Tax=Cognatishimia sp. SS12 TaxID=2979465 RepID=UPI00232F3495|nr:hypothetical protein [Cognatishimia sp. SS12]MDC0738036.1 hypothetical protein [Cognatishimia sp. SS12]